MKRKRKCEMQFGKQEVIIRQQKREKYRERQLRVEVIGSWSDNQL